MLGVVEWAATEGKLLRRAVDARARGRSAGQLPALALARCAADRARRAGASGVILEFLQQLAVELGRGNPEPLIAAAKLRFDELALAYQSDAGAARCSASATMFSGCMLRRH